MKRIIFLISISVIISGCSMTLPLDGKLQGSNDRFLGEATGYMDRTGILSATTTSGKKCTGDFKYLSKATGAGIFRCDDGREGNFLFNSSGYNGTGFGKMTDGEEFTFYFGNSSQTKVQD